MSDKIPVVEYEPAVQFECYHYHRLNYSPYTLESDCLDGAACESDVITCSDCGKDNKVMRRF